MSIEQTDIIDFISLTPDAELVLTISDHLPWEGDEHLSLLQDKINTYLEFMDSAQLLEMYPTVQECPLVTGVVMQFDPTKVAVVFLTQAQQVIKEGGIDLRWEVVCDF